MRRLPASVLLLTGIAALSACTNRTIDEAYGVPDALDWSYFEASPGEVAEATRLVLIESGYTVEAVILEGSGYVLTVTSNPPTADFTQLRIEGASFEQYRARVQTFPPERKLPSDLEVAISAEL